MILAIRGFLLGGDDGSCGGGRRGDEKCVNETLRKKISPVFIIYCF